MRILFFTCLLLGKISFKPYIYVMSYIQNSEMKSSVQPDFSIGFSSSVSPSFQGPYPLY